MAAYIITFHPISETPVGQRAVSKFGYPPYIDGSCRREPDFQSPYPSITSLCRGNRFVPRLKRGDLILYLTVQGRWEDRRPHWRLVGLLRVVHTLPSHEAAATWYVSRGLPAPSNCTIRGSRPLPISRTAGVPRELAATTPKSRQLRAWDAGYKARALKTPKFVVTRAIHIYVRRPPKVERVHWNKVFGKVLNTQSPQNVAIEQLRCLFRLAVGRDPRA